MAMIGYARVSTQEQNLGRQIVALKERGISEKNIFLDKLSGKNTARRSRHDRPQGGSVQACKSLPLKGAVLIE